MNPDKVMEDPIDIEALLEPFFLFGVSIGFSAIGCTASAQGGIRPPDDWRESGRSQLLKRLADAPGQGPDSLAACGRAYGRVNPCF